MKKSHIRTMSLCALFAALSAVLSQLSIPIGLVPIALTHVSIFLAAGLLGAKYGAVSQAVFVVLGAAGVPVFTGFRGGMDIIVGPRGGFIIGYILCAFIVGLLIRVLGRKLIMLFIAMYAGWIVTYLCGISWFMYVQKVGLIDALTACLLPFLLGDVLKTILSAVLINRLYPILKQRTPLETPK